MNMNQEVRRYTLFIKLLNGMVTLAALILIGLISMTPERLTDPDWVVWLLVIIGGLHTFEEYTFPGGFLQWFNVGFFRTQNTDFPLSAKKAFFIDAMAGLVIIIVLATVGSNLLWLTLGIACIFFINGCWHLISAIASGTYVPGAITSALLNLPLGAYIVYFYFAEGYATMAEVMIAYCVGLLVHIIFFGVMRRDIKQHPEQMQLASP